MRLRPQKTPPPEAASPAPEESTGSETAPVAVVGQPPAESDTESSGAVRGYRLDWLGRVGVVLLLLQGVAMLAWSTVLWQHFALTKDYGVYEQAWWLIAHGHLSPFSTAFQHGIPFWQNNLEVFMWPLALIGVVWSHGPVLLWIQDICLVGAELVAWHWMREVTAKLDGRPGQILGGVGIVLLLANPWAWWAISFDFHMELVALPFALLAAYDLAHDRRRAWLWVVVTLLCGDAEATWIVGLGLGALMAGRHWRWRGLGLIAAGAAWVAFSATIHGDGGGNLVSTYGYLGGPGIPASAGLMTLMLHVASHPFKVLSVLWGHVSDIWANLAPGGLIGLANPWALGFALPSLLANNLIRGNLFAQPVFQNVLLYVIVPLGSVFALVWLYQRRRRVALGLAAVLVGNAIVWTAVWLPEVPVQWLHVTSAAASVLAHAEDEIPASAEVVASQGVVGRFSDRLLVYAVYSPKEVIPLRSQDTWWIVAPSVGIETKSTAQGSALVADLAGPLHADLVAYGSGVWVFHWTPPPGTGTMTIPPATGTSPAWLFAGTAGTPRLAGDVSSWELASNGQVGYVLSGDYWLMPPGALQASISLSCATPVRLEVWNNSGQALLAEDSIPATAGTETVTMPVDATHAYPKTLFEGFGPFHVAPEPPPPGNYLEIRVWSTGVGPVDIQQITLQPAG